MVLKKRFLHYTLIVISSFLFSSCFQLVEDITVRKDGSGTAVLMANFSESRTKIASLMLLDSVQGYKVPSKQDIQREINTILLELKGVEGISKVSHSVDFEQFIVKINFSFANVKNLNGVTDMIFQKFKIKAKNTSLYRYESTGTFLRQYTYDPVAAREFNKLKKEDREVFRDAKYTSIYRFEREVKQSTNNNAKTASSKKAVMLQTPVMDLIMGKTNVSNQISFNQ